MPDDKNLQNWKILQQAVQECRIERIFAALNERGIESILIKGWAAARNYPQPFERLSVDVDAAVRPEQYAESEKILRQRKITGYDLHAGLRHLDTVAWEDLYAASEVVNVGGAPVRIPSAEDHLRILCVHWLGDGGADRDRLFDIYYAVKNRPADFDWDACLNRVNPTRRKWIVCAVGLAVKYLGLKVEETPLEKAVEFLPQWLTETIEKEWRRGVRLKPLYTCIENPKELFGQLKIRIPPNPIQATIEAEGAFDDESRIRFQIKSVFVRVKPSLLRIGRKARNDFGR